jgi:hypothetical protein
MHTYQINYITETTEGQATLTVEHAATKLQIVEAAARHCHPNERQQIGDIFDQADHEGMEDHLMLMAEWGISSISYTIDGELEEHQL